MIPSGFGRTLLSRGVSVLGPFWKIIGRYRIGHRQANVAVYRAVIVRMRYHRLTVDSVARRPANGRTTREMFGI